MTTMHARQIQLTKKTNAFNKKTNTINKKTNTVNKNTNTVNKKTNTVSTFQCYVIGILPVFC